MKSVEKYGAKWNAELSDLQIEIGAIKKGGTWTSKDGTKCGEGLFHHYRRMQMLLWPEDDNHRWSDLILKEILDNTITVLQGCKDSGKTRSMAKFGLCDYWCFPEETLIIISSTDVRSLEGRVWGDIKSLYRRAKERFDFLPGVILDTKHAIATDDLDDEDVVVRDLRRGILAIPCKTSSGSDSNIASYVGIKQKRRRYLADEFQFMSRSMYDSLANVNAGDFKMVCAGNPIGMNDPLDIISEPEGGWDSIGIPERTCVWKNRVFLNSKTVCLVGTDSPNFDYPETEPTHYWYLVNRDSIARTVAGYGKDSPQYWSQCVGVRRAGMIGSRIITETLCRQHHAFDTVEWDGSKPTTKIAGLDAAYGGVGGDRCIVIWGEFGLDVNRKTILFIHPPSLVPVSVRLPKKPEDQIAEWVMNYCIGLGIPPENLFYDSTGRGTLGLAFARAWSDQVNGVEFGGSPSNRIVSADMFITDMKTLRSRPLLCNEHYLNFVSELWYSVRYAIEADQIRGLPTDVAQEGYARLEMKPVRAKLQVEPKSGKGGMKERVGFSPDKFDSLVCLCEGARRRGFVISKLGEGKRSGSNSEWLRKWQDEHRRIDKAHELNYAV